VTLADDVETDLGRTLTSSESAQVALWEQDVALQVEARLGALADLNQDRLAYVTRKAIVARIQSPPRPNVESESRSIDDFTATTRYRSDGGDVEILPQWWALLSPADETALYSVRPSFEPDNVSPLESWA
jgi:hypothetical protein